MLAAGKSIHWVLTALLLAASSTAFAEEPPPEREAVPSTTSAGAPQAEQISDRQPPQYFSLERLDAYLEFVAEYDRQRVTTPVRSQGFPWVRKRQQENRDWGMEERIGLGIAGSIIDPRIINFEGDFSFALTQDRYKEEGWTFDKADQDNGYLLDYDMRVNFLPGGPLSGTVYGRKSRGRVDRRFQPTLDEDVTAFGTAWTFVHEKLPMELTYDYTEVDRTGNYDEYDDEHFTDSVLSYHADWLINDFHRLHFDYEHARSKQEYQGLAEPFETDRDLFTIEHELEFGPDHKHEFRTLVHWQEESGDFARDFFEVGPQLTLRHTDNLETRYKYQFNRERYAGLDIESHRADFQLVHTVFSNLVTTVDLFGEYEDIEDDVKTTLYGGFVDWQYNRRNRWGHLYSELRLGFDSERARADNGRRVVLNESSAFRDPLAITLRNRYVLRNSIVVTDVTNRRIYLPGRDYVVVQWRNITQLARVTTGRIADGETVLIDYQYATPANTEIDSVRVDFNIEQKFKNGLAPYYRWAYRNQDVNTAFPYRLAASSFWQAAVEDWTNHHRFGIRYEKPRYAVGVEYEIFDDSIDPYDAFHADGLVHVIQTSEQSLDGSARFSRFWFEGGLDDRNVSLVDVDVDHRWQLTETFSTFERLGYRWYDDSEYGLKNGWDASAGVAYIIGDLLAEVSIDYDRLELPDSEEDGLGVYFRVRREIPNVFARQ